MYTIQSWKRTRRHSKKSFITPSPRNPDLKSKEVVRLQTVSFGGTCLFVNHYYYYIVTYIVLSICGKQRLLTFASACMQFSISKGFRKHSITVVLMLAMCSSCNLKPFETEKEKPINCAHVLNTELNRTEQPKSYNFSIFSCNIFKNMN